MPKFTIGLIFFLILGGGAFVALPWITEAKLLWDCTEPGPSETCLTRMRAMGHVWSRKGDMEKARFWYAQPAERGDPIAMFHLAWTYDQAIADDSDTEYDQVAALRGDPKPDLPAADKVNLDLAKKWYEKSAGLGFAPALNNLGEIYRYGVGGRSDQPRGFQLLMKAARTGNPVARWNVSLSYMSGMGVKVDKAEAAEWRTWTRSAEIMPDLDEPTFSRTKLFGGHLPEWERDNLLASSEFSATSAENQTPTRARPEVPTPNQLAEKWRNRPPSRLDKPMKINPGAPTFGGASRKLPNQSTSWNKLPAKVDRPLPDH
jgi:hypothetical protein